MQEKTALEKPSYWDSYLQDAWHTSGIAFSAPYYKPTLLLSEPGNGAEFLALALLAGQGCTNASGELGCLECSICQQVLSFSNPDVLVIGFDTPLKLDVADQIGEHLQTSSGRKNERAIPRSVLILGLDRMNDAGVNRLLKLFEEPPENTWILATAVSEDSILETLLSRLTCLSLPPATDSHISAAYPGLDAAGMRYVDGSFGRADLWQVFRQNDIWKDLKVLSDGKGIEARFSAAERLHKKIKPGSKSRRGTNVKSSPKDAVDLPEWFQQSDFWHALDLHLSAANEQTSADGDLFKRRFMQRKLLEKYKKCTIPYNFRLALDAFATY